MTYRANQAFTTWAGGFKRRFAPNDVVPDDIARKVLSLTYDDSPAETPAPTRRGKKAAAADPE